MSGMMGDSDGDEGRGVPGTAAVPTTAEVIMEALVNAEHPPGQDQRINRDPPQPDEARRRLVSRWGARVKADKRHWERDFKRMRKSQAFAQGEQWGDEAGYPGQPADTRYVANVALRHVQQRTASLYANNPRVIAKRRDRILGQTWDGDMATLQAARMQMQQAITANAQQAAATGVPPPPIQEGAVPPGVNPQALAVITDFHAVQQQKKLLDRVGKTLELLWEYNVSEQNFRFKTGMKMTVRRAIVCGVAWVKLGFQRATTMQPEVVARIADMRERLATIERLAADLADDQIDQDAAEAEQLRLSIQAMMQEPQVIVREGLLFDYPDSTAVIPHQNCRNLRGFLGADWATQEYLMTTDEILEVYGVDVAKRFRAYKLDDASGTAVECSEDPVVGDGDRDGDDEGHVPQAVVWEVYSRKDGLIYALCDGWPDFLREPAAPDCYMDRFFPWFPILMNEGYDYRTIFPKSDIDLIRDMQLELNRARQGLREHRQANRPKTITAAGVLDDEDREKLQSHPANAVIELNSVQPGQKVDDVLQPWKGPPIDPQLYDTAAAFEDILRVLGTDQAAMGDAENNVTATEAAVADASRHTDLSSVVDDQDDMLSELAEAAGKVLMLNTSRDIVLKVCGPGAVWPELSKADIVEQVYLTIEAGSTGRPNKQQEVQNAQILFPLLQRVPGISPEWMAKELIRRLDDRINLEDAYVDGAPSMEAMNRAPGMAAPLPGEGPNPFAMMAGQPSAMPAGGPPAGGAPGAPVAPPMGGAPNDPAMQGDQGGRNAMAPPPRNGLLGPRTPPVPGANGLMPGQGGGPKMSASGGQPTP